MSIRKMLPLLMVAFSLLAASAAFAADEPPVPMSKEELLASLQAPSDQEGMALPEVGGVPAQQTKHASGPCTYLGVKCRTCSGGYEACDVYRCPLRRHDSPALVLQRRVLESLRDLRFLSPQRPAGLPSPWQAGSCQRSPRGRPKRPLNTL